MKKAINRETSLFRKWRFPGAGVKKRHSRKRPQGTFLNHYKYIKSRYGRRIAQTAAIAVTVLSLVASLIEINVYFKKVDSNGIPQQMDNQNRRVMEPRQSTSQEDSLDQLTEPVSPDANPASEKRVLQIMILLNGDLPYTRDIEMRFRTVAEKGCADSSYILHMVTVVGAAEEDANQTNRKLLREKIAQLPGGRADYIVTIGTGVSRAAYDEFFGEVPLIFAGVTDPVASGLVRSYEADTDRGPIAGVDYGLSHVDRLQSFARYLPGKRFGYVYHSAYNSDVVVRDTLLREATRIGVELTFIEVKEPRLNAWQQSLADIFFGHYYVSRNLTSLRESTSKPFIGGTNPDNLHNGSMMIVGNDDDGNIGAIAAKNVFLPNLLAHVPLHDIPVQRYTRTRIGINLAVFRQHDIAVPDTLRKRADIVIDEAPRAIARLKAKQEVATKNGTNSKLPQYSTSKNGNCMCPR